MNTNLMSNPLEFSSLPEHDRAEIINSLTQAVAADLMARVGIEEWHGELALADVYTMTHEEWARYQSSGGVWDYDPPVVVLARLSQGVGGIDAY